MATAQPDRSGSELDAILAGYLDEVEAGRTPDRREWLSRHPDHRAELSAFFANLDHVDRLAQPAWTGTWRPEGGADLIPFPISHDQPGRVAYFGEYELIRELGRGGMGVVYAARQASLDRVLALKLLGPRQGSAGDVQRFLREAVAAASLDHPNIVPIYEVGEQDGRHYYGMKLIDGGSLSQHAARLRSEPREVAGILARVAHAVHYAHERGVLHRDLKPANVLLDHQGSPYVADFGLARRVDGDAGLTTSGLVVGSPAYMAPEQAEGRRDAVTTATDVYGLGAILYEMLTGRPPFAGDSVLDVLTCVRDAEPEPPSRLNPDAPRDLETIALKCLEKAPARRYPSAAAVADELERFLAGEPILARPVSTGERVFKWARRHPSAAALVMVSTLALTVSAFAGQLIFRSQELRGSAEASEQGRRLAEAEVRARDELHKAAEVQGYADRIVSAAKALDSNQVAASDQLLDLCPPELRFWEWSYLKGLGHAEQLTIEGHNGVMCGVAFAPDPARFTCPDEHGGLSIWEAATRRQVAHLRGHDGTVYGSAFDPSGRRLATAGSDGVVRIWDVAASRLIRAIQAHKDWVASVAFSPDGRLLASAGQDGFLKVWDAATGEPIHAWDEHRGIVFGVAFRPDGSLIASANQDGSIVLRVARTGAIVRAIAAHGDAARCVAFSPDGRLIASGGADRTVRIWDVESGQERMKIPAANGRIDGVAFSPDGRTLATGGLDRSVKLWDVATGRERASYLGHTSPVFSVAFSPDGRFLASAAQDGTVKLWDAREAPGLRLLRPAQDGPARATRVAFSADGSSLSASRIDGDVDEYSLADGTARRRHAEPAPDIGATAISADGTWQATGDGMPLEVVQSLRGKSVEAPRGRYSVRIRTLASAGPGRIVAEHISPILGLAIRPDGSQVASSSADGTILLTDAATGSTATLVRGRETPVVALAFLPTEPLLAWADVVGRIHLHRLDGGPAVELPGHDGWVLSLAFTPDGRRLASAGHDGRVRLWDPSTSRLLLSLLGPGRRLTSVAFSPDGRSLAASSDDGSVSIWDTHPATSTNANRPAPHE